MAEAVRISACMPGLMRPVEVEECTLVDGDLQKSWPMWKLCETLSNLDENVLEIRLEGTVSENLASPISFINSVYSCVMSVASDFVVVFSGMMKSTTALLSTLAMLLSLIFR